MSEVIMPAYRQKGEGLPIIFLPGMEGAKEFWHYQSENLSFHYRTIACSYPVRPFHYFRTVSEYAADILFLMDKLSIEKAAIVGESFGGMVAQELAIEHQERVTALILCNTVPYMRAANLGINRFTFATFSYPLVFALPQSWRKTFMQWQGKQHGFVFDATPGNDNLIEYLMEHGTKPGITGYLDRIAAAARSDYRDKLERIQAPTLILRGEKDYLVDSTTIELLVGKIPGAQLEIIENGGHCCPHTMPQQTNQAMRTWLEKIYY